MKRFRKFTSRSFQKRTPRYGMSKPKMPPMPKLKKFQEGGSTDDLVPRSMLPDRNAAQQKKDMDTLMEYYMSDEVRERAKRRAKEDKEAADAAIREMMRNPPYKGKGRKLDNYVIEEEIVTPESSSSEIKRAQSKNRRRYNVGGKIDGCAIRGKTRGTII